MILDYSSSSLADSIEILQPMTPQIDPKSRTFLPCPQIENQEVLSVMKDEIILGIQDFVNPLKARVENIGRRLDQIELQHKASIEYAEQKIFILQVRVSELASKEVITMDDWGTLKEALLRTQLAKPEAMRS